MASAVFVQILGFRKHELVCVSDSRGLFAWRLGLPFPLRTYEKTGRYVVNEG